MHRIDAFGHINNRFTEGNPAAAVAATEVSADWLNAVQGEIVNVIEAAGLVLDKADDAQLVAAINKIISGAARSVPTIAALRAVENVDRPIFVEGRAVAGDGGGGDVIWKSGDQSVNVSTDPDSLEWVAPDSDPTGTSGAFHFPGGTSATVRSVAGMHEHPPVKTLRVVSYHDTHVFAYRGGGTFVWDADRAKSEHDGGAIISPTVPWNWDDNGTGYVAGANETDPAGAGCFVRVDHDVLTPAEFGARATTTYDSAASVHAALNHYLGNPGRNYTFDGGGLFYGVGSAFVYTSQVYRKQIKNLNLEALPGFTGEAILQFLPASGNINDLRITDSCLKGAAGQSAAGNCDGLLLLDKTQGVWIINCEMNIARQYGIKDLNANAGCEVFVSKCRISCASQFAENSTAVGVWFAGNDSAVIDCVIRECQTHAQFERGSISFSGNHCYNFSTARDTFGVKFMAAQGCVINDNYFDGIKVKLIEPRSTTIDGNKFLLQNGADWTGFRSFVLFESNSPGFALQDFSAQGNTFRCAGGLAPSSFSGYENGGTFDLSLTDRVYVRGNTFENVEKRTSHATGQIALAAATTGSVNLADLSIFGPTLPDSFQVVRSALLNASSGPVGVRAGITGSVVFVSTTVATSGTVVVEASVNADAT